MRYLITGGAGFVGSHLTEKLVEKGHEISILDNLSSGSVKNLEKVKAQIKVIKGNILDQVLIRKLVKSSDFVVHMAASVGVINIINEPLVSMQTNIDGTANVLEAANRYQKPVLITSTSEVYGKNIKIPLSEDDDRILGHPLKTRWSYSEAKAVDESLAYFYFLKNHLPIRIVRLFNTVGPRQLGSYGMVLPRFINAALRNQPLEVYGSGDQIRCFCHVSDAVKALLKVIDSDKAVGQVFNVGNDEQISIINLAKKVIKLTDSKSTIEKISYEKAYPEGFEDMQRRVPDISKIKQVLGWKPAINLEHIIIDVAAFNSKQT